MESEEDEEEGEEEIDDQFLEEEEEPVMIKVVKTDHKVTQKEKPCAMKKVKK